MRPFRSWRVGVSGDTRRCRFTEATLVASMALIGCGAPSTPDFIQKAAMSDMYEVEAGKLAADKGQSDAVKQFGQQMVDAHQNYRTAYGYRKNQKY